MTRFFLFSKILKIFYNPPPRSLWVGGTAARREGIAPAATGRLPRYRPRLGRGDRRGLERDVEHLADGHDRVEGHLLADLGGHVVEVGPVALRMITSVMPRRCAASTFCFRPPIGSTRPCSVTSPVVPTVCFTGRPLSSDARAVVMVTPALGPSFGIAPAGTCTWNSRSSKTSSGRSPAPRRGAQIGQRDARGLLHDVAELAGQRQAAGPLAFMPLASTKSMSPPTGVNARPVATPGTAVRIAAS